ncbi:MAG: hypothetical protein V1725_03900 [archaeon]
MGLNDLFENYEQRQKDVAALLERTPMTWGSLYEKKPVRFRTYAVSPNIAHAMKALHVENCDRITGGHIAQLYANPIDALFTANELLYALFIRHSQKLTPEDNAVLIRRIQSSEYFERAVEQAPDLLPEYFVERVDTWRRDMKDAIKRLSDAMLTAREEDKNEQARRRQDFFDRIGEKRKNNIPLTPHEQDLEDMLTSGVDVRLV